MTEQERQEIDRMEFEKGFATGNYANAYESEHYSAPQGGQTGFYRIGHLLGFYSTYESHEVPVAWRDVVEGHRAEFAEWL